MSQGGSQWQNLASHNLVLRRQSVVVLTVLFTIHAPYSLVCISQLVCLLPVGIFKPLMFIRNICFLHFEWHACELACVAKCITTINKHLFIYSIFFTKATARIIPGQRRFYFLRKNLLIILMLSVHLTFPNIAFVENTIRKGSIMSKVLRNWLKMSLRVGNSC